MPETFPPPEAAMLQTRVEHSRSLEDAERFRALDVLKELGLLVPVSDLDAYHGRVGDAKSTDEWVVDSTFSNAGNDTGHDNYNRRPTLYAGERGVAQEFARTRREQMIHRAYRGSFERRIRAYTHEERRDWITRENNREAMRWNTMPKLREQYPKGPRVYTNADVDERMFAEVNRLEDLTPEAERQKLRKSVEARLRTELYTITSPDSDATVINRDFDVSTLDPEARQKFNRAMNALIIPVTEGSPLSFADRDAVQPFIRAMGRDRTEKIRASEVANIATAANIPEKTALQLASAWNAREYLRSNPVGPASRMLKLAQSQNLYTEFIKEDGKTEGIPVNLEYIERFYREAHIVGMRHRVHSGTLGVKNMQVVSFFDLERVTTANALDADRQAMQKRYGAMAIVLCALPAGETRYMQPLNRLLQDAHAKPEQLVAAAMKVDGYGAIYQADAGNWEGFTLAEHTETVLRNFDENYADTLPVGLLAPMRLAILAHDLGKPAAARQGEKHRQKEYNVQQAGDFMDKLGVDERLRELLLSIIGDGEALASEVGIRGDEGAASALRTIARSSMRHYVATGETSEQLVDAYVAMCHILWVCDGGAYTSMAVTNRRSTGRGSFRNHPSFDASFQRPTGPGMRTVRPKNGV